MVVKNGSPDPDTLIGSSDDDILRGRGGDDQLFGGAGNDLLYGGTGNDEIYAGGGADQVYGGADDDVLVFSDLTGGTAYGGGGLDTLRVILEAGPSMFLDFQDGMATQTGTVPGNLTFSGMERLVLTSLADGDTVFGSSGDDEITFSGRGGEIHARGGNDAVYYIPHVAATLDGGLGEDTLTVNAYDNVLYFIVDRFANTVDDGQLSQISGFETYRAYGGIQNDIASFDSGDDLFRGQDGNDTAFGASGDDSLWGERGADSLIGGTGGDQLFGGTQNDTLLGGHGADTLKGGRGSDEIFGGSGHDRILLNLGNDTVTGGDGNDRFVFNRNQTGLHTFTDFTTGADHLVINDILLQFGPSPGNLDPTLFSVGAAVGAEAQFVLTYDATTDVSTLHWDPNGEDPAGGTYAMARFTGQVDLTASDILII